MTREDIESQLRADNPTTTDDFGERHGPGSEVYESAIQRWADAMEAQVQIESRKIWPNSSAFLAEFTMPEIGAISLSADPAIAALRLLLATWPADVWSDDPRIEGGLATLIAAGIITETRRIEIVAKPQNSKTATS